MFRPTPRPRFATSLAAGLRAAALACAVGVAGCGNSDPAPGAGSAPGAPAGPASGLPRRDPGAPRTARPSADLPGARELLARLQARAAEGQGLDATWVGDVTYFAQLLWPEPRDEADAAAARDHGQLAHVAGDVKPAARAEWAQRDPLSLEIHDAWLVAAAAGPDAYRAWVEDVGTALAQRLRAERARMFDRR